MKAAIVLEAGKTPVYGDFKEPVLGNGEVRVGGVRAGFFSAIAGSRRGNIIASTRASSQSSGSGHVRPEASARFRYL